MNYKNTVLFLVCALLCVAQCSKAMEPEVVPTQKLEEKKEELVRCFPALESRALLAPDPEFLLSHEERKRRHEERIKQWEEERKKFDNEQVLNKNNAVEYGRLGLQSALIFYQLDLEEALNKANFKSFRYWFDCADDTILRSKKNENLLKLFDILVGPISEINEKTKEQQEEYEQLQNPPIYYRFPQNILFRTPKAEFAQFVLEKAPERAKDTDNGYTLMHAALARCDFEAKLVNIYAEYPECSPFHISPHGTTALHSIDATNNSLQDGSSAEDVKFLNDHACEKFDRLMAVVRNKAGDNRLEAIKSRLRLINARVQMAGGVRAETVGWNVLNFLKAQHGDKPLTRALAPLYYYITDERAKLHGDLVELYVRNRKLQSPPASPMCMPEVRDRQLGFPQPLDELERECPICIEDIDPDDFTPVFCFHKFHTGCLEKMLATDPQFPCPKCHRPLTKVSTPTPGQVTPGGDGEWQKLDERSSLNH